MHEKPTIEQKDIAGTMATQGGVWCMVGNVVVSIRGEWRQRAEKTLDS